MIGGKVRVKEGCSQEESPGGGIQTEAFCAVRLE